MYVPPKRSDHLWGQHSLFVRWVLTSFLGLKRSGRGVDQCHQAPRPRMTGAIALPSLHACLARTVTNLPLRLPFPHRKRVCISVLPSSWHTARLFHLWMLLFRFPKQCSFFSWPVAYCGMSRDSFVVGGGGEGGGSSAHCEILVVQLSTVSCCFLPLRYIFSPQHPVFE